ncbi:MAG TPA: pyruvate kinase [Lacipirellulaceae bacterium]|nr:pyruvate kinase [Lacipirellulaceae bacterium]
MEPSQDHRRWARTKIVATVGPASSSPEMLAALARAGVDVFRLNMAHGDPAKGQVLLDRIRKVSSDEGRALAVLVDLAGPKIRLGEVADGGMLCELGATFFLVAGEPQAPNEFNATYEPLLRELSAGDVAMFADGTVAMRVEEASPERARMVVTQQGWVRSRQGINLPGVKLSAPALGEHDRENAAWAARAGADYISLSFVRRPEDVRELKELIRSSGGEAAVIAKIEKREALELLEEIIAAADGVMVARGDLGVEIDVARMPLEQKRIIRVSQELQKPTIIATQMLESMHESPRPTRAETTDVANAILDGADACMLSGETAIGKFPRDAVEMMNRIARATEESMAGRPPREMTRPTADNLQDVTRAVVRGAGTMAHVLAAKLVVVASHSGRTALALSQQRSFVPTIGVSDRPETLRKMCLYWGVTPLGGAPATRPQQLIRYIDRWACAEGLARKGDRIVVVGGSHLAAGPRGELETSGVHDIVIVHQIEGASLEPPRDDAHG